MSLPRSYLYVPGTRPDRVPKAVAAGADAVILDLEDAVAASAKGAAREQAAGALAAAEGASAELWVRVNDGALRAEDVRAVAGMPALTGILVAKAETAAELVELDALLAELGSEAIVEALVETAAALMSARELAAAPRVRRLQIGEVDLAADLDVTPGPDDAELLWARSTLVAASAAGGAESPVGPVSTDFRDLDAFRTQTEAVRRLGFWGRACIHPAQVPAANEVFVPAPERLAWARDVLDRLAAAERGDSGVALDAEGRFIDEAVAKIARRLVARAPAE